ncbi:MAG: BolA family transcriptional regulator [Gammaproteobacteria bacterium]|nr:BolA family transcriptional regulator [Gammaproteobacteria bacterium]
MELNTIKTLLEPVFAGGEVHVNGDGYHVQVIVVSDQFDGQRSVKRQQLVYAPLNAAISSGELHALSIKAFTPAEWQRERKLLMPS